MPPELPSPQPDNMRLAWPTSGLSFGGDYNPEQWPEEVWLDDIRLMQEARVNIVTLGVFSWAKLEPADGQHDFAWLDRIITLLDDASIAVDLATPTAAPPIWLHRAHPEILPVSRTGERYSQGGRLGWCPSSPVWREYSLRIVRALADRYAKHPAVRLWHVSNELGGGNRLCYCDVSADHFRRWLRLRYESIDAVNAAWGTGFWGHHYADFEEVLPPRDSQSPGNPSLALDFARFSSDALLDQYRAEAAILRERAPGVPVTTNFMVGRGPHVVDYAGWAQEMDVLANDHYVYGDDKHRAQDVAYSADRMRGLNRARPWLLMEHAASAVSWQRRNLAKEPREMMRHAMAHVARGADGAMFFQWRQSIAGAEQFHSAMVPHAGEDTRVWREVVELGQSLEAIGAVRSSLVEPARVALLVDDVSGWAWSAGPKPIEGFDLSRVAREQHRALWERNVLVDVIAPDRDVAPYELLLVPALFLTDESLSERLRARAEAGATVVVTFLSGIVDVHNQVGLGGYPAAFRDLLGVRVEEFRPLLDGQVVTLDNGWRAANWTEDIHTVGAETVAAYTDGMLAGRPAVTRHAVGEGSAWYVSTDLEYAAMSQLVEAALGDTAIRPVADASPGVELVRRVAGSSSYLFALNHNPTEAEVVVSGTDLLTGNVHANSVPLPAGGVAVIAAADTGSRTR